jgi:hypothetical protein
MKKFILALLIVMLAVGSAYAVDVQVTNGDYYVQGSYWSNLELNEGDTNDFMAYDHRLRFSVNFVVDETTKIVTRFEIADEEPWDGYKSSAPATSTVDSATGDVSTSNAGYDDNIEVRYVYLDHKFPTGTVLDAGKMTGGTWALAFNDAEDPKYRVKVTQFFPWGLIVGLLQKDDEKGYFEGVKDGEKDDKDGYALGAVINVGPVAIMPLWFHVVNGAALENQKDDDAVVDYYALGVTGNFGMVAFEAEYGYENIDFDSAISTVDPSVSGLYAKVWANFEAFKLGGLFYWCDVDDDAAMGFESGTDLDETYLMGEELEDTWAAIGYNGPGVGYGLAGWNCYQIFADFAFGKFSVNGSISYYTSNWKDDDSEAMEYDIGAAYKITDNLTYDFGLGMASFDADEDLVPDPDYAVYAFNRFKVVF